MSLKIIREVPLGIGTKGFRFKNQRDLRADREEYQKGRDLEKARFTQGSLAREIYDRLCANRVPNTNSLKSKK
jgi:hypothetical protein